MRYYSLAKVLATFLLVLALPVRAQQVSVKTNLLNWATTTINLGVEAAITRNNTVQLFYGLNPWKFSGEKKIRRDDKPYAKISDHIGLLPIVMVSSTWAK